MIPSNLKKQFNLLNKEQRLAVETIDGPVMVVAGPGTGKTQILTLRIANILLKTDANPENILALTFTESAAANMRRRLVALIGTPAYYLNIHTFHGFCNKLIQEYPENFPKIIGRANANPVDQIAIVRKIIDSENFKYLKPFGEKYYYVSEILKNLRQLKTEGINPQEFRKIVSKNQPAEAKKEKEFLRLSELAKVYEKYQKELSSKKLYDFEDMILETVSSLKENKDFLLDLQEKYQYILVDEHQDTNGAQNKVLESLASYDANPNLFVVGDEKQAIFRFQGASLENFLYFKEKFPKVKLINLENNYRSNQNILDASHSLIEKNTAVLTLTTLKSNQKINKEKIKIASFDSTESELFFVAEKIKTLIKKKVPPNEIAVLYRENKDALTVSDFLTKKDIPHAVESDENILENIEIKKLNTLLLAINSFASPEYLAPALHLDFLNIEPLEAYQAIEKQNFNNTHAIAEIFRKIGYFKKLSQNKVFTKFFETVLNDSGFLKNILAKPNYAEDLARVLALFNEIKKINLNNHNFSLQNYLDYLAILKEHKLPIQTKIKTGNQNIRLMTAHKAKGLEFDYVFIIGSYNGHWGNKRNISHINIAELISKTASNAAEKNEDERRLFYMALTRARKNVFITYALQSLDGREQVPSQFIGEIKPQLKEEIAGANYTSDKSILFLPAQPLKSTGSDKDFVRELFLKRGLSPTSLNNYLKCPWNFFYNNLLRIPKAQANYLIYGNAKHKALQLFFETRETNKKIGVKFLTDSFLEDIKKYPLTKEELLSFKDKGLKSLTAYYNYYKSSWPEKTINEYNIKGISFPISQKQEIKLNGKLDKLELKPNSPIVSVVDYKTGPIKTRNEILGKTKNSNGDYFRQLVFYKLLLDSLPNKKYHMELGTIDFTEPHFAEASRGKPVFKKEVFEILDADVTELKDLIIKSADEILNLKFWDSRCKEKYCEYCALRELLPKT